MGVTNCCTHAGNEEDKDQNGISQAKSDLNKIITANSLLGAKQENLKSRNDSNVKKLNSISYKPYIGISNYQNSNFINVNIQILSRLTYFKDFIIIMGKTSKSSSLIQNFIKIISNISQGIQMDSSYNLFIEEIFEKVNFLEFEPLNFHTFFLEKLCQTVYGKKLIFNNFALGDQEISIKSVDLEKEKFSAEFLENEIKIKFFTGYLNFQSSHCKNIKCNYKSQEICSKVLPFIECYVSVDAKFCLQDIINSIYFDKQSEGECNRCGKVNKKFKLCKKVLINYPKYLIIKIINKQQIPLELMYEQDKQIVFFSKNYEIFSIITHSSTNAEGNQTFSCSIKIDYKWVNFNDDIIKIIDEDNIFDDCIILYYQLR